VRRVTRAAVLLATLFAASLCWGQDAETLVEPSLIAEHAQVEPGSQVLIGVRFQVAPEWHLYWRNPGDSGVPPEIELELPEGVTAAGDWLWPTPHRLVLPGDLLNYVHEGELILLRRLKLASSLTPGTELRLRARSSWLVCKDVCLAGEGEASLTLVVGAEATRSPAADAIEATMLRVPRPSVTAGFELSVAWEGAALVLEVPGAGELTYFPLAPELPVPSDMIARGHGPGSRLEIVYPEPQPRVAGVLVARLGDATHVLAVELPAANEARGARPPGRPARSPGR
jgi:thiol:disulfide interchange protein DsbD